MAGPAALRTSRDHLEEPAALRHLAAAAAQGAAGGLRSRLGAGALAFGTSVLPGELDRLLRAVRHFIERQLDAGLEVVASARPAPSAAAMASSSKNTSEEILEAGHAEDVFDVHSGEVVHAGAAKSFMAVLIVLLSLLRIAQDLVGLGALLEFRLRFLVARILVRMVLDRHAAIGALDLVGRGALVNAQDLVVVAFGHKPHLGDVAHPT